MVKASSIISLAILLVSTILAALFSNELSLLHWINWLFICSLAIATIGAIMHVIVVGFFNRFFTNFNYFIKKISKTEQIASHIDRKQSVPSSTSIHLPFTYPLLLSGVLLTITSTIISYLL